MSAFAAAIDDEAHEELMTAMGQIAALEHQLTRYRAALEHIGNQSTGAELCPVGRTHDGWRFLQGHGNTLLEAIEDDARKAA